MAYFLHFVSVGSVHLILLVIFSTVSLMMDTHSISSDSEITRGGANLEKKVDSKGPNSHPEGLARGDSL